MTLRLFVVRAVLNCAGLRYYFSAILSSMRHWLEYAPIWIVLKVVGMLPRPISRSLGIFVAQAFGFVNARLRRVGMRNLQLAFPEKSDAERQKILRGVFTSLGRQFAEFCKFPSYTKENVSNIAVYDGLENFLAAQERGKGVLFLTGHLGAWEISSFFHSLMGHPVYLLYRKLDNPYLDRLVQRHRTLHGNSAIPKDESARGLLSAMRAGETVGVLMDTNMTPPEGVFVDFFGVKACTASGIARVAQRTGAAVLPAFMPWDAALGKYRLRFEPALELVSTGDTNADAIANTALFNRVIEEHIRKYPDQWLWVHRRWKTRPEGEPSIY